MNQGGGQLLGQPYGGVKESGIGRERSLEGMLDSFTETKTINVNIGSRSGHHVIGATITLRSLSLDCPL